MSKIIKGPKKTPHGPVQGTSDSNGPKPPQIISATLMFLIGRLRSGLQPFAIDIFDQQRERESQTAGHKKQFVQY